MEGPQGEIWDTEYEGCRDLDKSDRGYSGNIQRSFEERRRWRAPKFVYLSEEYM